MTTPSDSELDKAADRPFHRNLPATPPTIYSPEATTKVISVEQINRFFHDPAPPSAMCPQRFPGSDPESTDTLIRTLSHNHLSWHIFFNFKRFQKFVRKSHKYSSLTFRTAMQPIICYASGPWAPVVISWTPSMRFTMNSSDQHPNHLGLSRVKTTVGTSVMKSKKFFGPFDPGLQECRYYSAFLAFFKSELLEKGLSECLEEYVLSSAANLAPIDVHDGKHPGMLSRLIAVIFHALIHVGYGAEFGLLGLSAEGTFLCHKFTHSD